MEKIIINKHQLNILRSVKYGTLQERTNTMKNNTKVGNKYHYDNLRYSKEVYLQIAEDLNVDIKEHLATGSKADTFLLTNGNVIKVTHISNSYDLEFYRYFKKNPHQDIVPVINIQSSEVMFNDRWEYFYVVTMPYIDDYCKITKEDAKLLSKKVAGETGYNFRDVHPCNIGKYNGRWVISDAIIEKAIWVTNKINKSTDNETVETDDLLGQLGLE